mgnify:FL=1
MDNEALRKECVKSRDNLVRLAADKYAIDDKVLSGFIEATDRYLNNITEFPIPIISEGTYTDKELSASLLLKFNKAIVNTGKDVASGRVFEKYSLAKKLQSISSSFESGSNTLLGIAADKAYFAGVLPRVYCEPPKKSYIELANKLSIDKSDNPSADSATLKKEGLKVRDEFVKSLRESKLGLSSEVIDKFIASTDNYLNDANPLNGHAQKVSSKITHEGATSREFFYDFKESISNLKDIFDSGMIPCFKNRRDIKNQPANKENVSEFLKLAGNIFEEKSFCNAVIKADITGKLAISCMSH